MTEICFSYSNQRRSIAQKPGKQQKYLLSCNIFDFNREVIYDRLTKNNTQSKFSYRENDSIGIIWKPGASTLMGTLSETPEQDENPLIRISDPIADAVIHRARQGDSRALAEIYRHLHLAVYRYLFYRSGSQQVAEDLTAEVFIRVIEKISRFHPDHSSLRAWVFRIARNLSIDYFRQSHKNNPPALNENHVSDDRTEAAAEHNLNIQQLYRALYHLPPDQYDTIVLRFLSGMSIIEVAEVMNKSQGAVKMLQARGLHNLHQILNIERLNG